MTLDQFIALAASIGACFSAVATFLTVRQMAKQREASYRPELVFSRVYFGAIKHPLLQNSSPSLWFAKQPGDAPINESPPDLMIPLRNIGLGTARSVRLVWNFDVIATVRQANDLAQMSLTPAYFHFDGKAITRKSEKGDTSASMWENQRQILVDFVLPASIEKDPKPLRLPPAFVELCSSIVHFSFKGDAAKHLEFELPTLSATVTFKDIAGTEQSAEFEFTVQLMGIHGGGEGMDGYVESVKRA